jgi:hypothetical protein
MRHGGFVEVRIGQPIHQEKAKPLCHQKSQQQQFERVKKK